VVIAGRLGGDWVMLEAVIKLKSIGAGFDPQ
jgi:hypothetical protein